MNTKFKFIKMQLENGNWRTYENPSPQRLERLIKKNKPINIYKSVNQFIRHTEHNKTYPDIMIKKNFLIDIDGQEFHSPTECIDYFGLVLNSIRINDLKIIEINQTNSTKMGFQILLDSSCYDKAGNLIKDNPDIFSHIDKKVLFDDTRVCRYTPSWNGNHPSMAVPLPLDISAQDLNISKLQNSNTLGMPIKADDKGAVEIQHTTPVKTKGEEAIKSTLPSHYLVKQMNNIVYGAKDSFVPVIRFQTKPSKKRLSRLQNTYRLGDAYLFQCHTGYFAVCPKISTKRRLEKIYKKAQSWNSLNQISKFYQNWYPISSVYSMDTFENIPTFEFKGMIPQDAQGSYSKQHLAWLSRFHKKKYDNLAGNEKPKIFATLFSTK